MEMPPSNRRPWMTPRVNIFALKRDSGSLLKDADASDEHSFAHERVLDSSLNTLSMDETDAASKTAGDDATSEPHFVLEKGLGLLLLCCRIVEKV